MTEPVGADWLEQPVRITRDAVYFGDRKLPGLIAQDGIILKPGGANDSNRLSIEFLVGPVTADDPLVTDAPVGDSVQYSSRSSSDHG